MIKNIEIFGFNRAISSIKHSYKLGSEPSEYQENTEKDYELAYKLGVKPSGLGHDGFLKGIRVMFDLRCSQYLDHELQRYNFIDIVMSQSIQHHIPSLIQEAKNLTLKEFSELYFDKRVKAEVIQNFKSSLSSFSDFYSIDEVRSCIPESFQLWKTISTNYLQLKTIYFQRREHVLLEWQNICNFIEELPLMDSLLLGFKLDYNKFKQIGNYYIIEYK